MIFFRKQSALLAIDRRVFYDFGRNPANSVHRMWRRSFPPEQDDLLRTRLIDPFHELMILAALIDLEVFESEWIGFCP